MSDYKLSVIIPMFNCEKTINRAVDSVKRQSIGFSSIELILVDDCSTDHSYKIAKSLGEQADNIIVLRTEKNSGTAGAGRNLGIKYASGEYIMFLDDDDEYLPEACETLVQAIDETEDDFIQGSYIEVSSAGSRKEISKNDKGSLYEQYLPLVWDKIYRKSFLDANALRFCEGFFAEDESFSALCLAKSETHRIIKCPILCYHSDVESVSNETRNEFWRKNIYGSYLFMFEEAKRLGVEDRINDIYRDTGSFALYAHFILTMEKIEEAKTLLHKWIPVFSYAFKHGYNQSTLEASVLFPLSAQGDADAVDRAITELWRLQRGHIYDTAETPQHNIVLCAQGKDTDWLKSIDERFESIKADAFVMGQFPVNNMGALSVKDYIPYCPSNGCLAVKKEVYEQLGQIDTSLGWAATTDYYIRLKENNCRIDHCYDILSPSYEMLPGDVSEIWIDSLLLDYKHGGNSLRNKTVLEIIKKVLQYDPSVGNYSRKNLIRSFPGIVSSVIKNQKNGYNKATESFEFKKHAMMRGSFVQPSYLAEEPLVSVVIRTHSRPEVLRKTLESLRHLVYNNYEIIIVEDGEPTAKAMIEEDFTDLPICYFATIDHIGRSAAANKGFSLSKGKYINLLDDDDYFFPEHLTVAASVAEHGKYDMVFLQSIALSINKTKDKPYDFDVIDTSFMNFPRLDPFTMSSYCRTPNNGVFFKKDNLSFAVGMREDLDANEDWSLWLRMMTRAKYCVVPYATSCFVVPASEKEREKRMAGYDAYTGKQLEDDMLVYETSSEQLRMYYEGVKNDFNALEAVNLLEGSLKEDIKYWKVEDPQSYLKYANKMTDLILNKEGGVFTAKEFNQFYLGLVCEQLLKL